ncbi:MAG: PD-(D/E)XK nuclease family protein [Cyclobacteriaceae bacterium]
MRHKLATLSDFFARYRFFEKETTEVRYEEFTDRFQSFRKGFDPFVAKLAELRKRETPYFNVFDILNIRHYEEKVHTPFLYHLLTPNASHEQGSLFIDTYFRMVLKMDITFQEMDDYAIYQELSGEHGRIDLLINYRHQGHDHLVVIENKIYAADQPGQLARYHYHCCQEGYASEDRIHIYYLTLHKTLPCRDSLHYLLSVDGRTAIDHRINNDQINLIGYRNDIIPWLQHCREKVSSEKVNHLLFQYIQTISWL